MSVAMKSEPGNPFLRLVWRGLRSKVVLCTMGFMLLVFWCLYTPINKPPGTHIQIQLDRKYRPVGSTTISQKSRNDSWIVREKRGWLGSRGMMSFLPQRIELRCDSPFNATLIDLSGISGKELIALNTHPDARRDGVKAKPLEDYPELAKSEGQDYVDWHFSGWPMNWGNCQYRLVVECPTDPNAIIDVWVHYGGIQFDESH